MCQCILRLCVHCWCLYVTGFEVKNLQRNLEDIKNEVYKMYVILLGGKEVYVKLT